MKSKLHHVITPLLALSAVICRLSASAETQTPPTLKTETFDRDPGWDNRNNRVEASDPPTVTQDFGWSPGRIGGTVWSSTTPAWYGLPIEPALSFQDAFSASGKIAVTRESFERGVAYLGFFNHERQGWRPWSSIQRRTRRSAARLLCRRDWPADHG